MYSHAKFQNTQQYGHRETLLFWLFTYTHNRLLPTLTSVLSALIIQEIYLLQELENNGLFSFILHGKATVDWKYL